LQEEKVVQWPYLATTRTKSNYLLIPPQKSQKQQDIQLCPSTLVAEGKWPFHLPFNVVESTLKYGCIPHKIPQEAESTKEPFEI
jgi:hypothetical protein